MHERQEGEIGEAPAACGPDDGASNTTAEHERKRLGQERREAERLAAEQERQRKDQERIEVERLAELIEEWDVGANTLERFEEEVPIFTRSL